VRYWCQRQFTPISRRFSRYCGEQVNRVEIALNYIFGSSGTIDASCHREIRFDCVIKPIQQFRIQRVHAVVSAHF
jgi:hypothetical protein